MRWLMAFGLCAGVAVVASASPWEPKKATARAKLDEGRAAFQAKEYLRAGELFAASDAAEANLNARWNAAQSFAAAGDWKRASGLYDSLAADRELPKDRRVAIDARRALAARFMAAEYAQDAKKWDEARALLLQLVNDRALGDADRATAVARLDTLTRAQADAERPALPPTEPDTTKEASPPPPPRPRMVRPSRASDRISLVLIGAGVIGAGVGAGLLVSANGLDDDANAEPNDQEARALHDRADTRRTFGAITLGVGGAVLVAGVVKFILPEGARPVASLASFRSVDGGGVFVFSGALP